MHGIADFTIFRIYNIASKLTNNELIKRLVTPKEII